MMNHVAWMCWIAGFVMIAAPHAGGLTLARDGKPAVSIVLAADASLSEKTAAAELRDYLASIVGTGPAMTNESTPTPTSALFVGPTRFAAEHGIDCRELAPEAWVIRSVDDRLILAGGRPRGTLYAVYHFLEDHLGVRWWNPWEGSVPTDPDLSVEPIERHAQPVLAYRDIYQVYGRDEGRFAARNRLNRDGDSTIHARFGGCRDYGPPYHVHTFYRYFPPRSYLDTHPEYFSWVKGERRGERHQLCLSNPELRERFTAKLRRHIRQSEKRAGQAGAPPPVVYDMSQNDWHGQCLCEACQEVVERENAESGLMLDFVNDIASRIADDFPYVYIDTLAYQYTQDPPRHVRARDNVIIRLCDTRSNATFPITSEDNTPFRQTVIEWAEVAANLRIWDYAVTYQPPRGLPYPSEGTYAPDYRFYAEHNVEGVFTEHEYPVLADVRDFKVWLMMKLLEDPYHNPDDLAETFAHGFYGPAAPLFLEYRRLLARSQAEHQAYIGMGPAASAFTFLDVKTVLDAHDLFARGRARIEGHALLERRWRHARLSLDRATYARGRELHRQWLAAGTDKPFPIDVETVAARVRQTWTEQARMRLSEATCAKSLATMESELTRYTSLPLVVDPPRRFRDQPPGTVVDLTADMTRNWRDIVQVVKDPDAESGIANRLSFPNREPEKHPVERYKLPMPWGLYVSRTRKFYAGATIEPGDVPGPGYHWYHMGPHSIPPSCYLYFFWSWIIQQDLEPAVDRNHPERAYDIWARIKFTGPAFPHGRDDEPNAIYVERVVLVANDDA